MSVLLSHLYPWITPHIYPQMPQAGHDLVWAFAEWVFEFSNERSKRGTPATHIHEIHPERLECLFSQASMVREFRGYRTLAGNPRDRELRRGLAAALAHGALTAEYRDGDNHPTHKLVPALEGALARAVAIRDVEGHVQRYPVTAVVVAGVDPNAEAAHGTVRDERIYKRAHEAHVPSGPADAARLLARQADLAHVGMLGGIERPNWVPTYDVTAEKVGDGWRPVIKSHAADAIYAAAEAATGAAVARTPVPTLTYRGSRPVVTPEILSLLPWLEQLPQRMLIPADEAATDTTPTPAPSKPAAKRKKAGGGIPDSAWAALGVDRGAA